MPRGTPTSGGAQEPLPAPLAALLRLDAATLAAVLALARESRYEAGHTHQVTWLALRLFDELRALHGLGRAARDWLACAALLHDIGWVGGGPGHHKRALRLILDDPHLPWDLRVRRIVGSLARYHRRSGPRASHAHFAALAPADQAAVRALAALLRVADGLDYRHAPTVSEVRARVTADRIGLECLTTEPADVEVARAQRKGDLCESLWKRKLEITWRLRDRTPAEPS
jgi:exopolyphosphatase/guanosine-5'-triphosphate,3'-diphosphate pyrophosphatase